MNLYQRPHVSTLVQRLAEAPHHLIALFGPRQTGKTTIVRQALRQIDLKSRYLAVDEPDTTNFRIPSAAAEATFPLSQERNTHWLVRNWEEARIEADRSPGGFVLVFDEIQQIPNWSETVKGLWDADRARDCPLRVVILGSAPLLMQSGLSESLAGRFETIRVAHWSFKEMSEAFDFEPADLSLFRRLSRRGRHHSGPGTLARPHPRRPRRAEYRARHPVDDPRRQAGIAETPF